MTYNTLTLEQKNQIATITLTRPEKRNAISSQMIQELMAAFDEAENGPARVVIITGSGKSFCAGMDLDGLRTIASQSLDENMADSRAMARMFYRIYEFPNPVIALVNGPAIAGGCGIATLADFTLAAPEAKLGYSEVRIGFIPALVSVFLRRQIGEKRATDLLLDRAHRGCGGGAANRVDYRSGAGGKAYGAGARDRGAADCGESDEYSANEAAAAPFQ